MSSADDGYVDADAPIADEEVAAAAVVLASLPQQGLDLALARRCEADARAYFDARRQVRSSTTTSGTEVIIEEDDAGARRPPTKSSRAWTAGWMAVAACVGLGVFFARSRPQPSVAVSPAPIVAPTSSSVITVGVDGSIEVKGLAPCGARAQYVLQARKPGAVPTTLAVFTETPFRSAAAPTRPQDDELVVVLERKDRAPEVVGVWHRKTP